MIGILAVLVAPLVVGAVALRRPTWFPVLDLAMTELRVRDVGGGRTPLVGLPGRIGSIEQQGSHPGPLGFYLLAPTYRLLGSTAWALQVATMVVHASAMAGALWIARRRGGLRTVLGVAVVLAVLSAAYGFTVLAEPWNPYLPVLWWVTFLLAAWSVAAGDWPVLPVAVVAASVCAQTHLPYLGLTVGLGALAVLVAGSRLRTAAARRKATRPVLAALVVAGVLWAPVAIDQLTTDPGNASLVRAHMLDPPEDPVGFRTGARTMLEHLDLRKLAGASEGGRGSLVDPAHRTGGSAPAGAMVVALWAIAASATWRRAPSGLRHLHLVVGAGLALGVVSAGRVFGPLWYYLTLWAFAVAVLAVVAAGWAVAVAAERGMGPGARQRWVRATTGVLAALVVLPVLSLGRSAPGAEAPAARLSAGLGAVVEPTAAALRAGVGAADGTGGRYVVGWADGSHIGSAGYGLVSELERRGFDARGMPWTAAPLTGHRVAEPDSATAVVHLATGSLIERARALPGAVEVAYADPRTPAERREFDRLRTQVIAELADAGLDEVVHLVDVNLFGAALDVRALDRRSLDGTLERLGRMLDLGSPVAVFIAPPGTSFP